jgi:hypothetical protein
MICGIVLLLVFLSPGILSPNLLPPSILPVVYDPEFHVYYGY